MSSGAEAIPESRSACRTAWRFRGAHARARREPPCSAKRRRREAPRFAAWPCPVGCPALWRPQPAKHQDGNWIRPIATHCAGGQWVRDRASRHGVEATHTIFFIHHHKCSAGSAELVAHRSAFEPAVQGMFSALKIVQQVRGGKRLRCRQLHAQIAQSAQRTQRRLLFLGLQPFLSME